MSDILIRGMEMPFCCLVCPCSGTDNTDDGNEVWVCEASTLRRLTTEDKIERRPEWCPLVEIPPHGRLIDADANIASLERCLQSPENELAEFSYLYARALLSECPTIIPASEEGE